MKSQSTTKIKFQKSKITEQNLSRQLTEWKRNLQKRNVFLNLIFFEFMKRNCETSFEERKYEKNPEAGYTP